MAGSSNAFIGLDLATLTALQTAYVSAITALASNQSYSLNGRALTRANLPDVTATLGQINAAIADANGTTNDRTLVSFTGL
jgi:hypothetical protein